MTGIHILSGYGCLPALPPEGVLFTVCFVVTVICVTILAIKALGIKK
jgi:hypothetical protein